ncbi:MAG: hypothetical protein JWM24_1304, partial [Solirubrobacterales bacterium]|nr:hypothetical protein [Solirubrobacterales bacterium]
MTTVAAILFWASLGLLVYTHLGYPLVLALLVRVRGRTRDLLHGKQSLQDLPLVSLIVPAYDEEEV